MTQRYIIIIGCGRLGSHLANQLSGAGDSVVIIDRNEDAFTKLSAEFSGFRLHGDASEMDVLHQAKIDQADCLLATTHEDNFNLMATQVAATIFHVPTVIARVYDPRREALYHQLGVAVINPTHLSADAFLKAVNQNAPRS